MKKIKLTQDQWALVDDDDYEMLMEHKWYAAWLTSDGKFRAVRNSPRDLSGKQKKILIHRVITNAPKEKMVDHINGNPLDNRKDNLRVCTHQENCMNRGKQKNNMSGYKGVSYRKKGKDMINEYQKPWIASISFNGKNILFDYYKTKEEAALAYNKKAPELFGKFAVLNIIDKSNKL